ncbi:transmembrane protein 236 [Pimephales promelas]|uniref:transmembrane protein 236 n=1 Tax=Pimephales promelas TaxID=90988 RepID=UPI001955B801|nr:transmembrane protein 236 [Pimephales promelas]
MGRGSRIKFAVCEVLQFSSFCVPLFIIMQRFALIVSRVKVKSRSHYSSTAYWLIVASSVAYVTSVAMLIWLPMKYMVFMKKRALVARKKWRPVALAYVVLSTLPCFAFLIASSEVQIRNDLRLDTFAELPVSLVLLSLICIDIVERIRYCRLTGRANELARDADIPTLQTHIGNVTPVVPPAPAGSAAADLSGGAANGSVRGPPAGPNGSAAPGLPNNGAVPAHLANTAVPVPGNGGPGSTGQQIGSGPNPGVHFQTIASPYPGPLSFLQASDSRAEVFGDSFLFWLDTVEMVRVAGHTAVYFSGWAFPVYLFCFLSTVRLVITPHSPLLSPLAVLFQDLPFLVLRLALIGLFGFVTPVLYVIKNILVCLAYIYFNFMTKLRIFNTERMF